MTYRLALKSRSGETRRNLHLPTLDKFETQRAMKTLGQEENFHVGDVVVVEEVVR